MKKVYEAPTLEFEVIATEDIMAFSEENSDTNLTSIIGGDIEIDL